MAREQGRSSGLLQPGQLIGGVWEVVDRLGSGTFSEIYRARHVRKGVRCALKVDKPSSKSDVLRWESDILLTMQKYPFVARHYGYFDAVPAPTSSSSSSSSSSSRPPLKVLAMSLLGPNVSALRKPQPGGQLPYNACIHIGLQMLACIEALHQEGFLHRDIKPSNFVMNLGGSAEGVGSARGKGTATNASSASSSSSSSPVSLASASSMLLNFPQKTQLFLLDFGQSRQYVLPGPGHVVRPARETAEFRGTSIYSSLNAHLLFDLGRRDDLWSLFYVLVDMLRGGLPWRVWKDDRKRCEALKTYYAAHPEELVEGIPGEEHLLSLQHHLLDLEFEDKPDYALIATLLRKTLAEAEARGASRWRPRPPYRNSPELQAIVDSLLGNGGRRSGVAATAAGTAAAESASGAGAHPTLHTRSELEEGEVDGTPVPAPSPSPIPAPSSSSSSSSSSGTLASTAISPPPFSGTYGAAAAAGLDMSGMPLPGAGPSSPVASFDPSSVGPEFDMTRVPFTCDRVLHCRGGMWGEFISEDGVLLDSLLRVNENGDVSTDGSDVEAEVREVLREYEEDVEGWDHEAAGGDGDEDDDEENEEDGVGRRSSKRRTMEGGVAAGAEHGAAAAADSEAVALDPTESLTRELTRLVRARMGGRAASSAAAPEWIRGLRRPPIDPRLPEAARESLDVLVSFVRGRLAELPASLLWGAALSLAASSSSSTSSSSSSAAGGAASAAAAAAAAAEYLSAWAGLAHAVVSVAPLKKLREAMTIATDVQRMMQDLLRSATVPAGSLPSFPSSHSHSDAARQRTEAVAAAQAAVALLQNAAASLDFLPAPPKGGASEKPLSAALGAAVAGGIALRVHRALGAVEAWLAACGRKPAPVEAFASLRAASSSSSSSTTSSSAGGLLVAVGKDGEGESDGGDVQRKRRTEARKHIARLRVFLSALARERTVLRAATSWGEAPAAVVARPQLPAGASASAPANAADPHHRNHAHAAAVPAAGGGGGGGEDPSGASLEHRRSRWANAGGGEGEEYGGSEWGAGGNEDAARLLSAAVAGGGKGEVVGGGLPRRGPGGEEVEEEMEIE